VQLEYQHPNDLFENRALFTQPSPEKQLNQLSHFCCNNPKILGTSSFWYALRFDICVYFGAF
jgi:hypothetical protein